MKPWIFALSVVAFAAAGTKVPAYVPTVPTVPTVGPNFSSGRTVSVGPNFSSGRTPLAKIDTLFTGVTLVMKDGKIVIDKR